MPEMHLRKKAWIYLEAASILKLPRLTSNWRLWVCGWKYLTLGSWQKWAKLIFKIQCVIIQTQNKKDLIYVFNQTFRHSQPCIYFRKKSGLAVIVECLTQIFLLSCFVCFFLFLHTQILHEKPFSTEFFFLTDSDYGSSHWEVLLKNSCS